MTAVSGLIARPPGLGLIARSANLGLAFTQAGPDTGLRESFRLLDLPEAWVVVLVLLPAAAAVAWIGYGREAVSPRAKLVLGTLRFLALLLLLAVVFRPVFVRRREEVRPAEVVILCDDSASMRRKDAYASDERYRDSLRALAGRAPETCTRLDIARAALEARILPELVARGYVPRLYRFADRLEPLPEVAPRAGAAGGSPLSALTGRGSATHLGGALAQALGSHRGRHVTDVLIVSDGRSNGGTPPLDAARAAASAGVPVHTLVVGDTHPERNVVVEISEAPPSVLEGDEVEIAVRVRSRGTKPSARARVLLEELLMEDGGGATRPLAEEEVELTEAGARVVLVAPPGAPDARRSERRFRISVPPIEGETLRDDNAVELGVHVTPEKIRVLYLDGYPRWEYRRLMDLLKRSDQNIQVRCFLLSATPDFVQECTRGLPPLAAVPTGRKELLEGYDVVILGDVNPYAISPDPARCEEFLASLREFVERGGGLILQAGESDDPRAFAGTALEELLPVVVDATGVSALETSSTRDFHAALEDPASPHEVVRLVPDAAANRALWEDPGGLRGFYWYFPVVRAKPGAQVLLRHPKEGNSHGRYPLLVAGYFPSGRTLYLSLDETWRWLYRFGTRYHERFWRNAIRWVALGRLKSGDRRVQIDALRNRWNLDERVTLEARVLDEDYRPAERPTQVARLAAPDGSTSEIELHLVTDRPGLYRTTLDVERPGLYGVWIENEGRRVASAEFEVVLPSRENADPSPDPQTLAAVASLSGGQAVDLAHLDQLLLQFPGHEERREPISSELQDAWDNWGTLLLALGLLSAEWILRKRWELI